jgi:hypothetical protein
MSHRIHVLTATIIAPRASPPGVDRRDRELLRVERAQVLQLLADADQLDRDLELMGDRERDAAARRAVELRQHDPRDLDRLREDPRLAQAVLARRRVDGEQRLVRSAVELAADHAPYLRQLRHQVVLGVQAPRRVDDRDVDAAPARL